MKILFLCHRFPLPAEGGGKIRALHIVRHLVAGGHDVTVCSLVRSAAERRGVDELRAENVRCLVAPVSETAQRARMLLRLATPEPSSFGYFHSRRLARTIHALLRRERWDLIVAHCSSMGPYVRDVEDIPKIIDFADMDSQKWLDYARHKPFPLSAGYLLEGRKLACAERELARAFDYCTTISANEHETLTGFGAGIAADWFPNGVDLEYFSADGDAHDPSLVVFVGRMDYFPNQQAMQWFCDAVWPKLRAGHDNLKLRIVGANPSRSVLALAALDGVEVTGSVPDVRPHVRGAALTIAPLTIARGMQNKVLESMAMGIPVVTTRRVASGLGLDRESPLRIADSAEEYVAEIGDLVGSEQARARASAACRALAEREFSWAKAMQRFDRIVGRCLGSNAA